MLFDEQYDSFQYLFKRRSYSDPLEDVDLLEIERFAFNAPTSSNFRLWLSLHCFILLSQRLTYWPRPGVSVNSFHSFSHLLARESYDPA